MDLRTLPTAVTRDSNISGGEVVEPLPPVLDIIQDSASVTVAHSSFSLDIARPRASRVSAETKFSSRLASFDSTSERWYYPHKHFRSLGVQTARPTSSDTNRIGAQARLPKTIIVGTVAPSDQYPKQGSSRLSTERRALVIKVLYYGSCLVMLYFCLIGRPLWTGLLPLIWCVAKSMLSSLAGATRRHHTDFHHDLHPYVGTISIRQRRL
jgi:hypothetical protein